MTKIHIFCNSRNGSFVIKYTTVDNVFIKGGRK